MTFWRVKIFLFGVFSLHPVSRCERTQHGARQCVTTDALLTTTHTRGASWLCLRLSVFSDSHKSEGRQLNLWNSPVRCQESARLTSGSRTRRPSASMSKRSLVSFLNWLIGKPEITNRSNAGDLFTADRLASDTSSHIKPGPA